MSDLRGDIHDRLREAHDEAQGLFSAMLDANAYGDPEATETRRYVEAERHVDTILELAQWERSKSALDALIAAEQHDGLTAAKARDDLALGDHFVFPAGVGR